MTRRLWPAEGAGELGHFAQAFAIEPCNQLCQALGAELALRSKDRCSGIGEKTTVDRLAVVHPVRKGNQAARDTCDRDLGDRARSGAAHDEGRLPLDPTQATN